MTNFLALLLAAAIPLQDAEVNVHGQERLTSRISDRCELIVESRGALDTCWSLACEPREPLEIGCGLTAMLRVADLSVSPDRRWLAVISVGEGHPILEVMDLEALLARQGHRPLVSLNPFPGTIQLQGWDGEALLVASDMPLPDLPIPEGELERRMLPSRQVFALDPGTWRVRAVRQK